MYELSSQIKVEIEKCLNEKDGISGLDLFDVCEEMYYLIKDKDRMITNRYTKQNITTLIDEHIFNTYGLRLPRKPKRKSAGAIVVSENQGILFVHNQENKITIPVGKQMGQDKGSLKMTALRELFEETDFWLSKLEFDSTKKYFDYGGVRFFIVSTGSPDQKILEEQKFPEKEFNTAFSRFKEIKRLKWLSKENLNDLNYEDFPEADILHKWLNKELQLFTCGEKVDYQDYIKMGKSENDYIKRKITILGERNFYKQFSDFLKR